MELRTAASPRDVKHYTTERLREEFLIDDLFLPDVIKLVYSHIDRIITGSAVPVKETLKLTAGDELRAQYFCERRELGVINIGGAGTITIDGLPLQQYTRDGLRRRLAIVLQDGWLCGGTIAENIAYGVPGATRAQIEAALLPTAHVRPFSSSRKAHRKTALSL